MEKIVGKYRIILLFVGKTQFVYIKKKHGGIKVCFSGKIDNWWSKDTSKKFGDVSESFKLFCCKI